MRWRRFFESLITLFVLPIFLLYQFEASAITIQTHKTSLHEAAIQPVSFTDFSYDDVLDLLEELEEGDLENRLSPQELVYINQFIAMLAQNGILPSDTVENAILQNDVQELFQNDYLMLGANANEGYYSGAEVLLCKSWAAKKWKKAKKFVKKHKKAILIGCAVVAAAVVVVGAVAVITSAAAATAGAAAAAGSSDNDHDLVDDDDSEPDFVEEIKEQVTVAREEVLSTVDIAAAQPYESGSSFGEDVREYVSHVSHEILDTVEKLLVEPLIPSLGVVGDALLPDMSENPLCGSPKEIFSELIASGHEVIDRVFSTDQADHYAYPHEEKYAYGMIPPPTALGVGNSPGRIAATLANDTWGWKISEPIANRTKWGGLPKWSTVRQRYWKNKAEWAKANPGKYTETQVERMEKGLAPQRINTSTGELESIELHHDPAQRDGGLFDFVEVWPEEHAKIDPKRYLKE